MFWLEWIPYRSSLRVFTVVNYLYNKSLDVLLVVNFTKMSSRVFIVVNPKKKSLEVLNNGEFHAAVPRCFDSPWMPWYVFHLDVSRSFGISQTSLGYSLSNLKRIRTFTCHRSGTNRPRLAKNPTKTPQEYTQFSFCHQGRGKKAFLKCFSRLCSSTAYIPQWIMWRPLLPCGEVPFVLGDQLNHFEVFYVK